VLSRHVDPIPELKRQLNEELVRLMGNWTAFELYTEMRIDQPRISDLRRRKLKRFSLEMLIRLLKRLDHSVQLTVVKDPRCWVPQPPRARRDSARGAE
jgi:predicted XRE-type DNA-binding protein